MENSVTIHLPNGIKKQLKEITLAANEATEALKKLHSTIVNLQGRTN